MSEASVVDDSVDSDFFSHEPSKAEKLEMKKAVKKPSEWLRLLCSDWADENPELVEAADTRFVQFKSYLKGQLTSQLLCRLSLQSSEISGEVEPTSKGPDFWKILGIEDDFDKEYIVSQVERFNVLYNIRGPVVSDSDMTEQSNISASISVDTAAAAAAAAAGITVAPGGNIVGIPSYLGSPAIDNGAAAAAVAAAAAATASDVASGKLAKKQAGEFTRAHKIGKEGEKVTEGDRRFSVKKEQRRLSQEKKDAKAREREAVLVKRAADKAARDATREERRRKKLVLREQREKFAQQQKEAALQRAAELVQSNRVPIEITRGAAAAQAAADGALAAVGGFVPKKESPPVTKKPRSCIVVSTAGDLHQIVLHARNLWTKYNAIAKEHNQKVNWIVVAKELGIHVKVREKYARMHARAEQRGFDFVSCAHYKIKDYPQIFLEPTVAEDKAKVPTIQDASRTVLVSPQMMETMEPVEDPDDHSPAANSLLSETATAPPDDASVEAAAEAASVAVDAAIKPEDVASVVAAASTDSNVVDAAAAALEASAADPDDAEVACME